MVWIEIGKKFLRTKLIRGLKRTVLLVLCIDSVLLHAHSEAICAAYGKLIRFV